MSLWQEMNQELSWKDIFYLFVLMVLILVFADVQNQNSQAYQILANRNQNNSERFNELNNNFEQYKASQPVFLKTKCYEWQTNFSQYNQSDIFIRTSVLDAYRVEYGNPDVEYVKRTYNISDYEIMFWDKGRGYVVYKQWNNATNYTQIRFDINCVYGMGIFEWEE